MGIWGDGRGKGKNDKTRMLIISESRWKVFNALPAGFKIRKKGRGEVGEKEREGKGGKERGERDRKEKEGMKEEKKKRKDGKERRHHHSSWKWLVSPLNSYDTWQCHSYY